MGFKQIHNVIIALALFISASFAASASFATTHVTTKSVGEQVPTLDMLITGANKVPQKPGNLAPAIISRGDCVLCYHREMLKLRKDNVADELPQPFPGD